MSDVTPTAWEAPGATALIVPIDEADAVIGGFRRAYTPSGRDGMPAHVTLVGPFTRGPDLTARRIDEVRELVGRFAAFPVRFARIERFPATGTLYLAPDPAEPFLALIRALAARFPEHPPYAGTIDRVVPHLTVASRVDESIQDEIASALPPLLPIEAVAREVALVERGADLRFRDRATFTLRG